MAQSTTHRSPVITLFALVADIFVGIFDALTRIGEANSKVRQIKALSDMSDDELAARGMRREDIIRLVMADVI